MVWSNKEKIERRANWHAVSPPINDSIKQAHIWCNKQESTGKFYFHYTNTRWWFEKKGDAVLFALMWSGK